jgi:hypothetical protein
MNYLQARIVLLEERRPVPLKFIAVEAAALVSVAGMMVLFFA